MRNNIEHHNTEVKKLEELLRSVGPNVTPSPDFKQKLLGQLVDKVKACGDTSDFKPERNRKRIMAIRISLAAACLVFAVGFYFLVGGGVSKVSAGFAEMLARIRNVNTVAFEFKCVVPGEPEFQGHVYMKYPGQIRVVFPGKKVYIIDVDKRKLLVLWPNTKKATFSSRTGAIQAEPLEKLRQAEDSAGKFLGRETLAGKVVNVYQVALSEVSLKIWVDPQEDLPVRIESRTIFDGRPMKVMVIDRMQWNRAMPASFFAFNVPPDYTIEHTDKPSEKALLALMRICAEISDGVFPAGIDAITVRDLFMESKSYKMKIVIVRDKSVVEVDERTRNTYKTCLRGLAFISQYKENGSWHYAGEGVRRGDKDAPVCWWRPPGSEMFRVMFGDLQIRDIPAEQLPPQSGSSEFDHE